MLGCAYYVSFDRSRTVDYGLVKTHYLVKNLKIILDLCVPIIVSSQKKYSV